MSLAVATTEPSPKTLGTRFVSKQEFDARVKEDCRPREGCIVLTTSDDDIRQTEELLGVPAGLLAEDKYMVTDVVPPLNCFNCKQPLAAIRSYHCNHYTCGSG